MNELAGKRVGVTGSQGFIGKYVCATLRNRGAITHKFEDKNILLDVHSTIEYLTDNKIEYVIHLAGYNGGIEFNRKYPADIFASNTMLALNIISACSGAKVEKLLSVITSCAYPAGQEIHNENNLHDGPPEDTISCHGYAKRNLEIASRMYRKQYGLNAITVCLNTVYGPGDRTDPDRTKVMTGLIKKFVDAKRDNQEDVVCWGTGAPKREFIYVSDAANLIVDALEKYEETSPLNISAGQEYSVKELAELIARKVGYQGQIKWDISRPNGAMKKALDINKMKKYFGDYKFITLEQGIEETVKWHLKQ